MKHVGQVASHDSIWDTIRHAAASLADAEPVLGSLVYASVLNQSCFEYALSYILAQRLGNEDVPAMLLRHVFDALLWTMQRSGLQLVLILLRCANAIPPVTLPWRLCYFIKASMPFRPIGLLTHCCVESGAPWRSIFRAEWR